MLLHGASDLDQRCLKTRNSEDGCTFPPNIFAPTPKITPKTSFFETFQCKIYLRKSHVNGATKLKLYGNNRQALAVCQNFAARGVRGTQGPLM